MACTVCGLDKDLRDGVCFHCATRAEKIQLVADTIIGEMFAPHEVPLPDDLAELYRVTANKVLDALGGGDAQQPSSPNTWTPEQYWEYVGGLTDDFTLLQLRETLKERGLAVTSTERE